MENDSEQCSFQEWCQVKEMQQWLKERLIYDAKLELKHSMMEEKVKENHNQNIKWQIVSNWTKWKEWEAKMSKKETKRTKEKKKINEYRWKSIA